MKLDWGFPFDARKPHLFERGESTSLCGKWMYTGPKDAYNGTFNDQDCKACTDKLTAR